MNAKRFNYVMIGLFILLIGSGVGLTVYSNIWLTKRSKNLTETKLATITLDEKQKVNQKAQADLLKYKTTIDILDKITPKNKDQAKTLVELLQIADETGVTINSISFPTSDLGAVKKTAPVTSDTKTTPAPVASTIPSVTQTKPVDGISGILGIEVNLTQIDRKNGASGSGISYTQLLEFLKSIERNRRTMQVKLLQIQPITGGSGVTGYSLTMTINIFVKP